MILQAIHTQLMQPGDDLISLIKGGVKEVKEGSVLAVTSKVVSLWEGRCVKRGRGVTLEKLVQQEARDEETNKSDMSNKPDRSYGRVWKSKYCWLALKEGILIPNAGVDESNAFGGFILWPKDPFASAKRIQDALVRYYKVKKLGVLITDSWPMPLRHGVAGIALGYYGFSGQRDYMGTRDLHGRSMKITKVSVADTLASAAVLVMGEGNEQTPLALIEDAPVVFRNKMERNVLMIDPETDVYRPVLKF